jgi:hypothetical protein
MEKEMDDLQVRLFGASEKQVREWTQGSHYVRDSRWWPPAWPSCSNFERFSSGTALVRRSGLTHNECRFVTSG